MADFASVQRLIQAAKAPKANEMENWVTLDEAKAIVTEAGQANDTSTDQLVADLFEQGRPKDPQVYRGDGPHWSPNTWSSSYVDRTEKRGIPPSGTVFLDAIGKERFPGTPVSLGSDSAVGVLNTYLLDKSTTSSKILGSLWGGKREQVNGQTFVIGRGQSLSFQIPDESFKRMGEVTVSPQGPRVNRGGTVAYTPGPFRRPIRQTSVVVPDNAISGTEYTVKTAGISIKIRVA